MAKVESIVDPSFKSGIGKKGEWTLVKVAVDGKTATGFAPISVGDEVDLEYNDEYKNWNFKKIGPQHIPSVQVNADMGGDAMKLLSLIYDDTQKLLKLVDKSGYQKATETAAKLPRPAQDEVANYDIGDGEIDTSVIPF